MDNNSFNYTYSAKQQDEVKRIRNKYLGKNEQSEENKLEYLRALDASVTQKGSVVSLIIGVLSALVLGAGMSLALLNSGTLFILGIAVGVVGIAGIATAYPVYTYITKKEKEHLAPEILRLTEELLK